MTEGVLMECVYVLQKFYKVPRNRYSLDVYAEKAFDFVDCLLYSAEKQGLGTVFSFDLKLNKYRSKN